MRNDFLMLEEKANIYEFLASVFAKEPTVGLLKVLQSKESKEVFKDYSLDWTSDIKNLSLEEQAQSLAVEYAGLFLTPAKKTAPQESLQRGEGRLWGNSTVEVNNLYRKFGFALEDSFKDVPDHLSAELSFLAQLCQLEGKYEREGLEESKLGVLQIKKYFLGKHLLKWVPAFAKGVMKNAKLAYYREAVRLAGIVLNEEYERLKGVKDIFASKEESRGS